ncbi:MAG: DMT family transporter [Betaproteobacteria bacterium]|nr:DMT family transporter [Betaproteobacteria bacterium]
MDRSHFHAIIGTALAGIAFAVIWSLSFVVSKAALQSISPLWLSGLRLILAGGILLLVNGVAIWSFWRNVERQTLLRIVAAGVLSQAGYLGPMYWALVHLPTSIVNVVVSSLPLMSLPFSYFLLSEKIGIAGIVAFLLSIAGVTITLLGGNSLALSDFSTYGLSALLVVASVVALALGNVLIKPLISSKALLPFCAIQFISSGALLLVLALGGEGAHVPDGNALSQTALHLAFLAGVGSILGTVLWFRVLRAMPANAANSFFLLTPIFGVALGHLIFSEAITMSKIIGILVIFSAITLRLGGLPYFKKRARKG